MTRRRRADERGGQPSGVTIEFAFHLRKAHRGRRRVREGPRPEPPKVEDGRIPRISKMVALALHIDGLIQRGVVRDLADAARLCHVSRARVSQVMDLLSLAPDLMETLLFSPRTVTGRDPVTERGLRRVVVLRDWDDQRQEWARTVGQCWLDRPANH